jgi:hypothetical protein
LTIKGKLMANKPPVSVSAIAPLSNTAMLAGVLGAVVVFQLLMVGSYIGAFHNPTPSNIPVAVVAPSPAIAAKAMAALGGAAETLSLRVVADQSTATRLILDGELYGAVVLGAQSDQLIVARAGSPTIADALSAQFKSIESASGRSIAVVDVAPLSSDDARGVAPFYLVLGWVVGGYLGASVAGLLGGMRMSGRGGAGKRVGALALFAVASGVAVTVATSVTFGVVTDHLIAVMLLGSLVVFATAAATAALQAIFGIAGTAIVLLLFVVLGNPASGGPAVRPLLPGLWRRVGGNIVNGAGTDAVRAAIYFPTRSIVGPVLILLAWAAGGVITMLFVAHRRMKPVD